MAEGSTPKGKGPSKGKSRSARSQERAQRTSQSSPIQEHSFLTDRTDVKLMENELIDLMDDFHQGKLQAFGSDFTIDKMDKIRELQEKAAQMHFEMDNASNVDKDGEEDETKSDKDLGNLMKNLENLSSTIQSLHKGDLAFQYLMENDGTKTEFP